MSRSRIDLWDLQPEDLRSAAEPVFLRVVDADLKRASHRNEPVPEWITHALRTEHLDRWRMTLRRMLVQVDGRLRVLAAEWDANRVGLAGTDLVDREAEHQSLVLRSERFRAGVLEGLAEAEMLYESRLGELEDAIRTHRDEVEADDSIEASAFDERLWSTLTD